MKALSTRIPYFKGYVKKFYSSWRCLKGVGKRTENIQQTGRYVDSHIELSVVRILDQDPVV